MRNDIISYTCIDVLGVQMYGAIQTYRGCMGQLYRGCTGNVWMYGVYRCMGEYTNVWGNTDIWRDVWGILT